NPSSTIPFLVTKLVAFTTPRRTRTWLMMCLAPIAPCDDETSNHEDASDIGAAPKQQQQVIPQTTVISNIKLLILKKEGYDIWAMEMEHYLEYIDNDIWKVIQNGNSKKRISTGKDGVIRILPPEVTFVSQSKSSTNKVKSGFTGAYNTCTPSTSSTNIPEKKVLAGFADEVIYSLFAKQSED
ncbi:hypothetical protein Tco_0107280, partial [Tanacetum coccineum]